MYLKALCFAVILLLSAVLLVAQSTTIQTIALVVLVAWASARLYYFCFYVIEKYVDPSFRFDGLISLVRYLMRNRNNH